MTRDGFEKLVAAALDTLPEAFARRLDNVEVTAEAWPSPADLQAAGSPPGTILLGLYRGVPQTQRGNYTGALPDTIVIFAGPLLALYGNDPDRLTREVRNTVLHEIGHHFGMSDEEISNAQGR